MSLLVLGVLGAYAYMGPKAGRDVFALNPETADLTFGVITVLTGILGTVRSWLTCCQCH
jgi:MFS transporter, Spinster family, sphingosine-1-phosphate transporter